MAYLWKLHVTLLQIAVVPICNCNIKELHSLFEITISQRFMNSRFFRFVFFSGSAGVSWRRSSELAIENCDTAFFEYLVSLNHPINKMIIIMGMYRVRSKLLLRTVSFPKFVFVMNRVLLMAIQTILLRSWPLQSAIFLHWYIYIYLYI